MGYFLERMDNPAIIQQLLGLLAEQGVAIRYEAMGGGGGGLCCLNGRKILILDRDSSDFEAAISCARAVGRIIPDTDSIYLRPAVREFIDKYAEDG